MVQRAWGQTKWGLEVSKAKYQESHWQRFSHSPRPAGPALLAAETQPPPEQRVQVCAGRSPPAASAGSQNGTQSAS